MLETLPRGKLTRRAQEIARLYDIPHSTAARSRGHAIGLDRALSASPKVGKSLAVANLLLALAACKDRAGVTILAARRVLVC